MSNYRDMVNNLGRAGSLSEALGAIRETHGTGASRYLSDQYGVSQRTAQRWLAGTQKPSLLTTKREQLQIDPSIVRKRAAQRMRAAKVITAGKVAVVSKSSGKSSGSRNIGVVAVDPSSQSDLERAADALESGDIAESEDAFSDALMGAYSASKNDNPDVAKGALSVDDYPDGFGLI